MDINMHNEKAVMQQDCLPYNCNDWKYLCYKNYSIFCVFLGMLQVLHKVF